MTKEYIDLHKAFLGFIEKHFGGSSKEERYQESEESKDELSVSKSVDVELKQATFLVLSPEEVDEHEDIYSAEEIAKACHNFNEHCKAANLFHLAETNGATVAESYIAPADFYLDETLVKKGSWLQVWQFNDSDLWDMVKSGDINGVSIGCLAVGEDLSE